MDYKKTTDFEKTIAALDAKFDELIADIRGLHEFNRETELLENLLQRTVNEIFDELKAMEKTRHGFSTSKDAEKASLWNCWHNINNRCKNPFHPRYRDYGGRGIENRFGSFEEFARHVEFRPSPDHSIDRIDNDAHYEPGNLKWSNRIEQAANRRPYRRKSK